MITHIRFVVSRIGQETGKPISDILSEIVSAVQSGVVDWENRFCPLCGEKKDIPVTSSPGGFPAFVRLHKCGYCGTNFQSHEKKSVETTDYPLPPIAKLKKKPHIKKRGA